jgi:FAD/FMN-containing dehydrogenase/Fe-S oxidoreductase
VPRPEHPPDLAEPARRRLAEDLRRAIRGEVRFDDGDRALYATDGSNYRFVPTGVVVPRSIEDVVAAMEVCRRYDAAVVPRGGGTDLTGSATNTAVVIDCSKYLRQVIAIDPERREARVQPGTVLDDLREQADRAAGLTFGPDPSTHDHNTFGGMIGNDSCGVHSVLAAKVGPGPRTADNVKELEILTYDGLRLRVGPTSEVELARIIRGGGRRGEIYAGLKRLRDRYADLIRARYPRIPRRVSGYNLDELLPEKGFHVARALVGSEGTLVTVLEATVELIHSPPYRALVILGYPSIFEAGDHVPEIMSFGPVGLEAIDHFLIRNMRRKGLRVDDLRYMPEGKGFLLAEFGGDTREDARAQAERMMAALRAKPGAPQAKVYQESSVEEQVWKVREAGLGATARVPGEPDTWEGWEDSAVPPAKVGAYLRGLRKLYDKFGYRASLYGHFGQGCIHTRIPFDLKSQEGVRQYRRFMEEASDLCLSFGGSLSGEHGDGQSRGELLVKMFGPELMQAFREFKAIWDPRGRMNPGKKIDARPFTSDLRLGPGYNPIPVKTYFKYPEDRGSLARATTRCVGVGACRRTEGGTMCPSFMVTREEKHSTRGRAHLLFEMLQGNPLRDRWQSEAVKESLDLCLACKGCKGDCPVNVDVATYKAEFLAHYYRGRLRPIAAYTMGLIQFWARLAARMPGLANFATQTPGLRDLVKQAGGIHPDRRLPPFAKQTFQAWYRARGPRVRSDRHVLLWPDTFNNHFHTEVAKSAVRVLESAGFEVEVHQRSLCCGRPLYDYGMLDEAQRYLLKILDALRPQIRAGLPVVVLEPSCASVFRDEMRSLFPHDLDAARLRGQVFTLGEFLKRKTPGYRPPKLRRKALLHGHCHQKSVLGFDCDRELLKEMELDLHAPDTGCCGMAGSFGFENDPAKFAVSTACGERVLLPAVRGEPKDALIISDGFSCKTQIEQGTARRGLHLAQVIDLALRQEELPDRTRGRPEDRFPQPVARPALRDLLLAPVLLAGIGLLINRVARRPESRVRRGA